MSFSLFLFAPNTNEFDVSKEKIIEFLIGLDFISLSANSLTLLPGKQLMDFITFLGCSPSLKMGEIESTIRLFEYELMTGMGGDSIETIKYPTCKHPVSEPTQLIKSFSAKNCWQCPVCGAKGKTDDINWRKSAGFSKIFIEVSQIFPKEAIPSDKLLNSLQSFTKTDWKWFYSRSTT